MRPANDGGAKVRAADARGAAPDLPVHELRAFNRFYTNLIGALDYSRHLYAPYTLTEARVLYELAHSPRTDAADLRTELSLDAGYLSRLLARFEKDELVERAPSERDPRRQRITLTAHGRSATELLDARSQEKVGALLATVPADDRPRLTAAMRTIRGILTPEPTEPPEPTGTSGSTGTSGPLQSAGPAEPTGSAGRSGRARREDVLLRARRPGDLGWIIQRNAALYAAEYGWNEEYEALVARIVADFAEQHDPRLERIWMAELDGRPVGCVMCVRDEHAGGGAAAAPGEGTTGSGYGPPDDGTTGGGYGPPDDGTTGSQGGAPGAATVPDRPGTARLRLLLVEPDARGLGVGDLLVTACIDFARASGYDDMVLWTNDVLSAARRIYQRHGFTLLAERPHRSFGADLVGQDWQLRLRD